MSVTDDDFLGAMQVGDDGVTFAHDLAADDDQPQGAAPPAPTLEEKLAAAEARLEKYKALDSFAEALERDPSKIYDMRAAAEGRRTALPGLTEHDAPKPPDNTPKTIEEAIARLPEAERLKLRQSAIDEPEMYGARLADISRQMAESNIANSAQPIVDATVAGAIQNFKLSHASEPIYRHAEAFFEAEMDDFDRKAFYQLPEAKRKRELELRWAAAKARAYDAAAAKAAPRQSPRNLGAGSGNAGGGTTMRRDVPKTTDSLLTLAGRAGLKPGQLEAIMKGLDA